MKKSGSLRMVIVRLEVSRILFRSATIIQRIFTTKRTLVKEILAVVVFKNHFPHLGLTRLTDTKKESKK